MLFEQFNIKHCFLNIMLIITIVYALYLMIALVSFNPSDPSWFQTSRDDFIHNMAGVTGAWYADALFFTCGILAYSIPLKILFLCGSVYLQHKSCDYVDFFVLSFRFIGSFVLLLTSCSLAALNIDDFYYFTSGGIIGILLKNIILPWLNGSTTLVLLFIWILGFVLFTGCSLFSIARKINSIICDNLFFLVNRSHHYASDYNFCVHVGKEDVYLDLPIHSVNYDISLLGSSVLTKTVIDMSCLASLVAVSLPVKASLRQTADLFQVEDISCNELITKIPYAFLNDCDSMKYVPSIQVTPACLNKQVDYRCDFSPVFSFTTQFASYELMEHNSEPRIGNF